jgi:hypothetical protein
MAGRPQVLEFHALQADLTRHDLRVYCPANQEKVSNPVVFFLNAPEDCSLEYGHNTK